MPTSLVAASDGNLYGTAVKGDVSCPHGTVFKATRSGNVSTLHRFGFAQGAAPYHLMQARTATCVAQRRPAAP